MKDQIQYTINLLNCTSLESVGKTTISQGSALSQTALSGSNPGPWGCEAAHCYTEWFDQSTAILNPMHTSLLKEEVEALFQF